MSIFRKRFRLETNRYHGRHFNFLSCVASGRWKKASVGQLAVGFNTLKTKLCIFHGDPERGGSAAPRKIEVTTTMSNRLECRVRGCSSTFVNHRTCNFKVLKPLNEIFIPFAHSSRNKTIFNIKCFYVTLKSFQRNMKL